MIDITATAGMNWISDAGHYLNTVARRDGMASVRIVRTWDYKRSRPFAEPRPADVVTARIHGKGVRYTMNGRTFPAGEFVRVIAELGAR